MATPLENLLAKLEASGQLIREIDDLKAIVAGYSKTRDEYVTLAADKQAELDKLLANPASSQLMVELKAAITGVGL